MVANGFKRGKVPFEYLKANSKRKTAAATATIPGPEGLYWAYVFRENLYEELPNQQIYDIFVKSNI